MSTNNPLPAEQPADAARLKLKEALGHRWWGFVLALNFFLAPLAALALARVRTADSPALSFVFWLFALGGVLGVVWFLIFVWKRKGRSKSYLIGWMTVLFVAAAVNAFLLARRTPLPELSPLFWYLIVVLAVVALIFCLFVRMYARTAFSLKEGDVLHDSVPADRWPQMRWGQRASAVWNGIIRLEFFGWVIWVTAAVAAIAGALRNTLAADPTFAGLSVLQKYFRTLDAAAFDLIRATVIGTIVLFFVQLLKTYQDAIMAAAKAAKDAEQASQRATEAVVEAGRILPTLSEQIERTLDLFKTTGNVKKTDMLAASLGHSLRIVAESAPALKQVEDLSDRLFEHVDLISRAVTYSHKVGTKGEQIDYFDLISLSAIYSTYLKVESLSFERLDGETGRGGFRLSTRYPHYILAVRNVVEAITLLDPDHTRYKFYTVFNRNPRRFFNPRLGSSQVNISLSELSINWTALFLEQFCRQHHKRDIPYLRHFLACERGGTEDYIPGSEIVTVQLDKHSVLCNVRDGKRRPCLWGEPAWEFFEEDNASQMVGQPVWAYLLKEEQSELRETVKEVLPSRAVRETLKEFDVIKRLRKPSYVIVNQSERGVLERAVRQHDKELEFRSLKDVLLDYHSASAPPKTVVFRDKDSFERFFGDNLPRDLLAVWDTSEKRWCLCIGTMIGENDPTAMVMIVTTKDRELNNLRWGQLEEKLSMLFFDDNAGRDSPIITRDSIR